MTLLGPQTRWAEGEAQCEHELAAQPGVSTHGLLRWGTSVAARMYAGGAPVTDSKVPRALAWVNRVSDCETPGGERRRTPCRWPAPEGR